MPVAVKRSWRALVGLLTFGAIVTLAPGATSAHTDFDFSVPADGETVGEAVAEITVAFTLPVTLVGNGFEVLDPQANLIEPVVVSDDNLVFVLRLDPPLAGGAVGVRYEVTAEDGHVLADAFSFTVDAPAAATTTVAAPTTAATSPTTVPQPVPATDATQTTAAPTAESDTADAPPPSTTTVSTQPAPSDEPVSDEVAADSPATEPADDDGGANVALYVALAALVAAGGAAFVFVRSRSAG